jgi:hypothetical protein
VPTLQWREARPVASEPRPVDFFKRLSLDDPLRSAVFFRPHFPSILERKMIDTNNEKCLACGRELPRTGKRGRPRKFCAAPDCQRDADKRRKARHGENANADFWNSYNSSTGSR